MVSRNQDSLGFKCSRQFGHRPLQFEQSVAGIGKGIAFCCVVVPLGINLVVVQVNHPFPPKLFQSFLAKLQKFVQTECFGIRNSFLQDFLPVGQPPRAGMPST